MIFFRNKEIIEQLVTLSKKFAMDASAKYKNKRFYVHWSEASYDLGMIKYCWNLVNELNEFSTIEYFQQCLVFSNIKDKDVFLKKLKAINLLYK